MEEFPHITGRSLIAGEWGSADGRTFHARNPESACDLDPTFHEASEAEAARAIEAAERAVDEYGHGTGEARAELLETIAIEIDALGDVLVDRASSETGLPRVRITGERGRTLAQLRSFAALVREGS